MNRDYHRNARKEEIVYKLRHGLKINKCLVGVDLSNIDLSGCILTGFDFTGADFRNSNLIETDFSNSCVKGAKFLGAQIHNTCFKKNEIPNNINLLFNNKDNSVSELVETICPVCKESFYTTKHKSINIFCSYECESYYQ